MLPHAPCPQLRSAPGVLMLRTRLVLAAALALAFAWGWQAPVEASDYFRECKALDGEATHLLDLEAGELRKAKGGPLVPFKTVEKERLRQVTGFCNTKGGRFKFHTEVFGVTVEYTVKGKPVRQRFACEHAEDATPAGLNCEKEVRTIDFEAPEKVRALYK
jgi:hypothetical protein